jgi:tetratricopeptide (TPR) repeat protein
MALSRCYREAGDFSRAIEVGEDALAALKQRQLDGLDETVQLEMTVAAAYFERGDELHAVVRCRQAADKAEDRGSAAAKAAAYWNASVMESRSGNHTEAIRLADRALALLSDGNDQRNIGRLRLQLGVMLLRASDSDSKQAEKYIRRARRELAASAGSVVDLARCDAHLAIARLDQEDADAAESLATAVLDAVGGTAPLLAADAHVVLGRVAADRGDRPALRRHFKNAASALTAAGADRSAAQTWYELAGLLDEAGENAAARDAYRSAAAASGLQRRSTRARSRINS